jgi:hypothetical protein
VATAFSKNKKEKEKEKTKKERKKTPDRPKSKKLLLGHRKKISRIATK